ncbi:MAG: TniB family NTP-binding protein [Gammaproteobacteria bacterium]|nr:TniB family NTP-binding protein [Gammaproteobacteria bacterium]
MDLIDISKRLIKFDRRRVKNPMRSLVFSRLDFMVAYSTALQMEKDSEDYDPYEHENEQKGLIIAGSAGVGKSSLAKTYVKNNKPSLVTNDDFTQKLIPTLYYQLPGQVTFKRIIAGQLRVLGYHPNMKHDEDTLTTQLLDALQKCKVKIIILDEIQHLTTKKNIDQMPLIQNSLKGLINACDQHFVFIGDETTPKIIKGCGQLGRRAPTVIELLPFTFPSDCDSEVYQMINPLLDLMPSDTGVTLSTKINRLEFCQRLYLASGGVIDAMRFFMHEALSYAMQNSKRTLDYSDFVYAYQMSPSDNAIIKKNPFGITKSELTKWLDKELGNAA